MTPLHLAERLRGLLSRPETLTAMEDRLAPLARPDADRRVAELCLDLLARRTKE